MSERAFFDAEILLYALESSGPGKVIRDLLRTQTACLSTQVLGDFYRLATSPERGSPLTVTEGTAWVQFWKRCQVSDITVAHIDMALEWARTVPLDYSRGLLLASAKLARCTTLYTENLPSDVSTAGLKIINPFRPDVTETRPKTG